MTPARSSPGDAPTFSPLYRQIKGLITRSLQAGEWNPGDAIPSEVELAARFKVSQGTVRKAIDELATENLLIRRQGKGTFVSTHSEENVQYRFLRLSTDSGKPLRATRRFLDCRRLRAPAEVAQQLSLRAGSPVLLVRRILSVDDRPAVLDDIWLPGTPFKGLTAERLHQYRGPMYAFFEEEFGVRMIRAEEKIRAVSASEEAAALLGMGVGAPLLSVERLSLTYQDQPVELRRGLYDTTAHHYRNVLN
ncbi:MAG: GntR family transcriptional regulator [Pseudomonadota bacterium]